MSNQLSGKRYFSLTTKDGVTAYIAERQKDVDAGIIVKGKTGNYQNPLGALACLYQERYKAQRARANRLL
jgi:hypothetical protein